MLTLEQASIIVDKALEKGADGLIAVSAGAGGHAGVLSPFALISEIREFFDGPLALSGAISTGRQVAGVGGLMEQEVMSLWIFPVLPTGLLNNTNQRTTVEAITRARAAVVTFAPSPW